jgi:hypothetical protein
MHGNQPVSALDASIVTAGDQSATLGSVAASSSAPVSEFIQPQADAASPVVETSGPIVTQAAIVSVDSETASAEAVAGLTAALVAVPDDVGVTPDASAAQFVEAALQTNASGAQVPTIEQPPTYVQGVQSAPELISAVLLDPSHGITAQEGSERHSEFDNAHSNISTAFDSSPRNYHYE